MDDAVRTCEPVEGVTDAARIADSQSRRRAEDVETVLEQVRKRSQVYFEGGKAQSSWEDAVRAMRASPQGIEAVLRMAKEGHMPMVYLETPTNVCIGTGSTMPPNSSLGSAYNAAAGAVIDGENQELSDWKKVRWQGTAVGRVAEMGLRLMPVDHWERIWRLRYRDGREEGSEQAEYSFLDSTKYLDKRGMPSLVMAVVHEDAGSIRVLAQTPLLAGSQVGFHCYTSIAKLA